MTTDLRADVRPAPRPDPGTPPRPGGVLVDGPPLLREAVGDALGKAGLSLAPDPGSDGGQEQDGAPRVIVLGHATTARLREAIRLHRGTPVVAVVPAGSGADEIVGLLAAGADACVRGSDPALVVAHVQACLRRSQLRSLAS